MKKHISYINVFIKKRIILLFFIAELAVLNSTIKSKTDDFVFAEGISRYGSIFGWASFYGKNWGGRIIPHGILVLLLQTNGIVFNLLNTVAYYLLFYKIFKIVKVFNDNYQHKDVYYIGLSFLYLFSIPANIISSATFWKCASVLYLWGTLGCLYAITPFVLKELKKTVKRSDYLTGIMGGIIACGFEQISLFMIVFVALYMIILFHNRTINKADFLLGLFLIISSLLFICFPGNDVRRKSELLSWFTTYEHLSLSQKLTLGLTTLLESINFYFKYSIFALAVVLMLRANHNFADKKIQAVYRIPVCYYLFNLLLYLCANNPICEIPLKQYTNVLINAYDGFVVIDWISIVATIFAFGMFSLVSIELLFINKCINYFDFLLIWGGGCTTFIMCFSPTIYASGRRARYIFGLFILIVLLNQFVSYRLDRKNE